MEGQGRKKWIKGKEREEKGRGKRKEGKEHA